MPTTRQKNLRPGAIERSFGRILTFLIRVGLVRGHFYVLEVRGRKSGRKIAAMRRRRFAARELSPNARPPILKAYLDRFATEVQRFFPVPKGSAVEAFNDLAPGYPVFELQPLDEAGTPAPRGGLAPPTSF